MYAMYTATKVVTIIAANGGTLTEGQVTKPFFATPSIPVNPA